MSRHTIRLAGPWTCQVADAASPINCRLPFPSELTELNLPHGGLDRPAGQSVILKLSRKFHLPTGLSATTRVLISLEASREISGCSVNGADLERVDVPDRVSSGDQFSVSRFEVTGMLSQFNTLEVTFQCQLPLPEVLLRAAVLEILEDT